MESAPIPIYGVVAIARLYDEFAPKTISALRTSLPYSGPGIHAIRAGCEVFTLIPAPAIDPGAENLSIFSNSRRLVPRPLSRRATAESKHPLGYEL
jgi:hypothetical protein